ncbi:hypothetical protein SDC9_98705 [bioreactor metagenome]|uniref:Radical SAM core domain-containing protein n=1 Tax=bioreactor metagenome TaxID=1076179 RepID=A0A645AFG8_9ZZZZ
MADKHPLAVKTGCGKNPYQAKTDLKWLETLTNPYFLPFDLPDINQRYLYIEGSRGCPHHCQYCLSSTDNHVRFFSLDYLFRIFDLLSQYQIRQVKFLDRTFNVNNARALLLITYLNKMSTKSNFHLELVAETLSDELLAYLENELASDRFRFEIGVQSFNQTTLQAVGRYTDTKRLAEVIGKLRRHDNLLHTDLIAGLPFEDFRSFATSYNTLYRLAPHEIQVGILKLLKGTALRNQAEQLRIDYNVTAPYEIIANPWLSAADLNQIKLVHRATEKCYNNQKLQHTLHELVSYQRLAPFDLMLRLGQAIERLPHPYQEREFYQSLIQELVPVVPYDLLSGLLAVDYYRGTKQKPSPLFELIDYHSYLDVLSLNSMADQQMLDNYCLMTAVVYKNRRLVQLIVYNTKQMPALRYIIDRENSQIKELL